MPSKAMVEDTELTQPLPEVTKGVGGDTEAAEADMPASSPRSFGCGGCTKAPRGKLYAYDWLRGIPDPQGSEMVRVQFKNTRSGFYRNDQHLDLKPGDMVAVEASPGHDIGEVVMTGPLVRHQMRKASLKADSEIRRVFRIAKPSDLEKYEEAMAREHDTMIRSRKIAEELGLNMKIGDVEYQGDGAKAIFYYIADERVDFRKLIRILADTFKIRVEMKQIGARQEAGRIGGIGPCGRPLCCASWLSNFVSVGTSAARFQDISMNPQKLAGQCGKLKCCLNYETAAYMDAQSRIPRVLNPLEFEDGMAYLMKTDILKETMYFSYDQGSFANLYALPASEVREIIKMNRNGVRPESLKSEPEVTAPEFVSAVGDDSITRFDESRKKRSRNNHSRRNGKARDEKPRQEQRGGQNRNNRPRGKKKEA